MMNKVAVLLAVAVAVQGALALNQLEVEREIGLLMGHEKVFSQYCMDSYSYVVSDIKIHVNDETAKVYNAFFGATTEIADEVLTVERQAVAELAKQVASPEQEVNEGPIPEDKVLALIEEGKREIQQRGLVGRLVSASKSAGQVLYNAANSAIFVRLAKVRAVMSQASLVEAIKSACHYAKQYEQKLAADLAQAKSGLSSEAEPELKKFIDSVSVSSLKCFTPKTVTRVSAFCELLKNGAGAFMKMLGLNGSKINFDHE